MSYFVKLENGLRAKIASWGLAPRLVNEVLEQLYEVLAEHPRQHLRNAPSPEVPLIFSFIVRAEGDPPRD